MVLQCLFVTCCFPVVMTVLLSRSDSLPHCVRDVPAGTEVHGYVLLPGLQLGLQLHPHDVLPIPSGACLLINLGPPIDSHLPEEEELNN